MPTSCVVFGCASRWIKSEDDDQACLKFFAMPRDPERRKLWTNAINRKRWTAKDHHRVCSRHFIQGKPSRNPLHPDHIPSLHMGGKEGEKSVGRGKGKLARFERTVERRQKESASFQVDLPPEDHRGYVDFSLVNERPKEWKRDHHVSFEPVDACVQTVVGFAHAADRLAQLEEENARLREKWRRRPRRAPLDCTLSVTAIGRQSFTLDCRPMPCLKHFTLTSSPKQQL